MRSLVDIQIDLARDWLEKARVAGLKRSAMHNMVDEICNKYPLHE